MDDNHMYGRQCNERGLNLEREREPIRTGSYQGGREREREREREKEIT